MQFLHMVRAKAVASPDAWIAAALESLLHAFARSILRDREVVLAAIREPWSNGQREGQIKCQMYGRAKFDLLEARLMGAACPAPITRYASEPIFHAETPP